MHRLATALIIAAGLLPQPARQQSFAGLVASLSEPGGYFDTDNLISNERSYLHVVPELRQLAPQAARTGVYIGVGPDQNFSYIAQLRPSLAIIADIRRDNMLLHLLFKALFAESVTRSAYLAMLTGRAPPAAQGIQSGTVDAIVKQIDSASRLDAAGLSALQSRLMNRITGFGVPLADRDRATTLAFHRRFVADGLSLRFNSTGRAPQYDYPTLRDLLLEVDKQGVHRSFIASEEEFQFVKSMQDGDRIIPIVGDLAGSQAFRAVAKYLADNGRQVTAFYTSNVEQYLFRNGSFAPFIENLGRLPKQPGSLIIRSAFPSGMASAPILPGYNSASMTQSIKVLLDGYGKGQFRQYWELIR